MMVIPTPSQETRPMRRPAPPRPRTGFTLVEVLVAIVIVGVLAALLLPAIGGAVRTAKNAAVAAEMNVLATSLESFKTKYGEYPPSRIMLCEDGYWNVNDANMVMAPGLVADRPEISDITYGQLAQKSLQILQKFWPGLPVTTVSTEAFDGTGRFHDFNGNGIMDSPSEKVAGRGFILTGDECLVFFLGGLPSNMGTAAAPKFSTAGFARGKVPYTTGGRPLPAPFRNNRGGTSLMSTDNRDPANFEFKSERLLDIDVDSKGNVGDGFPCYADNLTQAMPYCYFASRGGTGYDPNDCNFSEPDGSLTVKAIVRAFRVSFPVQINATLNNTDRQAASPAPNPYTAGPANSGVTTAWQKGSSFQLLSAGADGLYGAGGEYDPKGKPTRLPLEAGSLNTTDIDIRDRERDNITNFSGGPLD